MIASPIRVPTSYPATIPAISLLPSTVELLGRRQSAAAMVGEPGMVDGVLVDVVVLDDVAGGAVDHGSVQGGASASKPIRVASGVPPPRQPGRETIWPVGVADARVGVAEPVHEHLARQPAWHSRAGSRK